MCLGWDSIVSRMCQSLRCDSITLSLSQLVFTVIVIYCQQPSSMAMIFLVVKYFYHRSGYLFYLCQLCRSLSEVNFVWMYSWGPCLLSLGLLLLLYSPALTRRQHLKFQESSKIEPLLLNLCSASFDWHYWMIHLVFYHLWWIYQVRLLSLFTVFSKSPQRSPQEINFLFSIALQLDY